MELGQRRSDQKLGCIAEASSTGARVIGVQDIDLGRPRAGGMDVLLGRDLSWDHVQVLELETLGATHVYGQPYAGIYALPGEHHVWMRGGVASPLAFVDGTWRRGWEGSPSAALEGGLREAIRQVRWEWCLGGASVSIPWWLQLRPFAGGTHVTMAATGLGTGPTFEVGFAALTKLCRALAPLLGPPNGLELPFRRAAAFGGAFVAAWGARQVHVPPPSAPIVDVGSTLHALLKGRGGGPLMVAPAIDPSRLDRLRRTLLVLEPEQVVLGVVDLSFFSGASAIVLTPTHCFARTADSTLRFAWSELREVEPPAAGTGAIRLHLQSFGIVRLPAGRAELVLYDVLEALLPTLRSRPWSRPAAHGS